MNCTAIILAGGKSSRMGTDKGLILIQEIAMVKRVIETVKKTAIKKIIIIANNDEYRKFGFDVYPDILKEKGPLGGIYAGLKKSTTSKNLVLSCDIPFINEKVIDTLLQNSSESQITVVKHENRVHNLIGVYNHSLTQEIGEHILNNKLKVGLFNESKDAKILDLNLILPDLDNHVFANINTKEDLEMYEYGV